MATMSEHNFTCNTCGLSFSAADYQREHMRTDWHRYNLKRRVAELPPVPSEVFAEKMIQQRTAQLNANVKDPSRRQLTKKDMKRLEKQRLKQAVAEGAYTTDETSHTHSRASSVVSGISALSLGDPKEEYISEDDFSSEDRPNHIPEAATNSNDNDNDNDKDVEALLEQKLATMVKIEPNTCFMDGKSFSDVEQNLAYLESKYGLVVPESRYLADIEGFVGYLNEKVGLGNCCLACGYMGRSLEAVRAHMIDKQHVKIPWDTDEQRDELLEFYDFETDDDDNDGNDWEDASDDSDIDENDEVYVDNDGELAAASDNDQVYVNGHELVFSSGKTAGHRSLQRYYKQRLSAVEEKPGRKAVRLIDNRSAGVSERAAEKMIKGEWAAENVTRRKFARGRKQQNYQAHFRDPLLQ